MLMRITRNTGAFFPTLMSGPLLLRPWERSDFRQWRDIQDTNKIHLTKWEPEWPDAPTTQKEFDRRCTALERMARRAQGLYLLITLRSEEREQETIIGGISLNDIRSAPFQSATMGYWLAQSHTGKGYARNAVNLVTQYAFEKLAIKRVSASAHVQNTPSHNVLTACGFHKEGLAHSYLRVNGIWSDHYLYARISGTDDASRNPA